MSGNTEAAGQQDCRANKDVEEQIILLYTICQ